MNLTESEMVSYAWKYAENESGVQYNLQIDEVPWNFKKALREAMCDWEQVSFGWNIKSGNQVFIYRKSFKDEQSWERWASAFPLEVLEKRVWGSKEKVIKHKKAGQNVKA